MDSIRFFKVDVLASEYWKSGQFIIQISESDFLHNNVSKRKRLMKRAPEYWIWINVTNDVMNIRKGLLELKEEKTSINGKEVKYCVNQYNSILFEEQFNKDFVEFNPSYTHDVSTLTTNERNCHKEGIEIVKSLESQTVPLELNFSSLTVQETEFINIIASKIGNIASKLSQECPPHKFIVSSELKVIFCEKCGKTKPV